MVNVYKKQAKQDYIAGDFFVSFVTKNISWKLTNFMNASIGWRVNLSHWDFPLPDFFEI